MPDSTPVTDQSKPVLPSVASLDLQSMRDLRAAWSTPSAKYPRGPWLETYTGLQFFLLDPQPEDIAIEDIAHALSNEGRYNGHTKVFYSVAEHCCIMADYAMRRNNDPFLAYECLMHDAAEAYVGDMPKPLKNVLPTFETIEDGIMAVISRKFGLPAEMSGTVKLYDMNMLLTERADLLSDSGYDWELPSVAEALPVTIHRWTPRVAEHEFMRRFDDLQAKISQAGTL